MLIFESMWWIKIATAHGQSQLLQKNKRLKGALGHELILLKRIPKMNWTKDDLVVSFADFIRLELGDFYKFVNKWLENKVPFIFRYMVIY